MRGSHTLCRAFGSLLLLGSLFLTNVVTHHADAKTGPEISVASDPKTVAPLPAPPRRLLVIVPHPDDASLGGTALITETLRNGGQVKLVVMTSGDGFRLAAARTLGVARPGPRDLYQLGLLRQQEELASARQLGLRPQDVLFLGYPDSGLHQLWSSSHWLASKAYQAINGFDHVPYPLAFHQGAPYCGQSVVDDLRMLVNQFQPTDVLFPDPHDVHNDHWATSAFTQYVLDALPQSPQTWTYLIHYPNFPVPRLYRPLRPLTPPNDVAGLTGLTWYSLPIDRALLSVKKRAILSHQSQVSVMGDLLLSFLRTNDLIGHYTLPTVRDVEDTVLVDPAWDDAKSKHISAADIRKVAMVHSVGQLLICVEYAGEVRHQLDYYVRLRLPDLPVAQQRPLEFHVHDGKLSNNPLPTYAGTTPNSQMPTVNIDAHRLILSLPDTPFRQAHRIMFSTDVSHNQQTLDKTAWSTLLLQKMPAP